MGKAWESPRARLALALLALGLATQAHATDVSNYSFNPYAYRTIAPTPPAARQAPSLRTPPRPNTAALPLPDNGACVGICRLLESMWRLERPGDVAAAPAS